MHSETPSGIENPLSRDRPARPRPWRADVRRRGLLARRHAARDRRVACRSRGRGAAEVPRRPARDVADHRQLARVGGDGVEPERSARVVPVAAGLEAPVDRRRPRRVPLHAFGQRRQRRARRARGGARRGARRRRSRRHRQRRARDAAPACGRWGSSCGRGASPTPPTA